jgi:Holliday junction resolvase RusA-like endonuclease
MRMALLLQDAEAGAMKTVFRLNQLPPSTNNLFLNGTKGRFRSQKYETWLQEANLDFLRQRPKKIAGPVNITMEFREPTRKSDLDNRVKAPLDFIVKAGVIEADDNSIVRKINLAWSDEVEGCKITIESIFGSVVSASVEAPPTRGDDGAHPNDQT